jgi:hypothetical protein
MWRCNTKVERRRRYLMGRGPSEGGEAGGIGNISAISKEKVKSG